MNGAGRQPATRPKQAEAKSARRTLRIYHDRGYERSVVTKSFSQNLGFQTRAVHLGELASPSIPSVPAAPPIVQASGFAFESIESLEESFSVPGSFHYSRAQNPTAEALERAVAALEGGDRAAAYASGMAAIHGVLTALLRPGDRIVAPDRVYGGSHAFFQGFLREFGVETSYAKTNDIASWRAALERPAQVVFAETITNPTLEVVDLGAIAEMTHRAGAKLVVDATFTTPYLSRPLAEGADYVVHSATKYLGGHGDLIAGLVVGGDEAMRPVRRRLIETGGNISPFVAWLVLRGLRTLGLRVERHCATALELARFLETQEKVERVFHPALPSHPDHARVQARFGGRGSGMVSLVVKGGLEGAKRFINRLELFARAGSLGDTHSLAVLPSMASHRHLSAEALSEMGITPGFVRLSVGLEDPADLIADVRDALGAI